MKVCDSFMLPAAVQPPLARNLVLFYHMASKKLHSDYEMQFSVNEMLFIRIPGLMDSLILSGVLPAH